MLGNGASADKFDRLVPKFIFGGRPSVVPMFIIGRPTIKVGPTEPVNAAGKVSIVCPAADNKGRHYREMGKRCLP
jgi:hypothetical protein